MELHLLEAYLDPGKDWSRDEEIQLDVLMRFAQEKVLNRRFPYDDTVTEVPARYQMAVIRIAAELYAKMGAEGQTSHSENGISRVWESADTAKGILQDITPLVGLVGVERDADTAP